MQVGLAVAAAGLQGGDDVVARPAVHHGPGRGGADPVVTVAALDDVVVGELVADGVVAAAAGDVDGADATLPEGTAGQGSAAAGDEGDHLGVARGVADGDRV